MWNKYSFYFSVAVDFAGNRVDLCLLHCVFRFEIHRVLSGIYLEKHDKWWCNIMDLGISGLLLKTLLALLNVDSYKLLSRKFIAYQLARDVRCRAYNSVYSTQKNSNFTIIKILIYVSLNNKNCFKTTCPWKRSCSRFILLL